MHLNLSKMLDSDSSSSSTDINYNEVYSLFTKCDLEDVLVKTNKEPMTVKEESEGKFIYSYIHLYI